MRGNNDTVNQRIVFKEFHRIVVHVSGVDDVHCGRGGGKTGHYAVNMFEDFDIDYNKETYLIETRISGALTVPFSALVLETEVVNG